MLQAAERHQAYQRAVVQAVAAATRRAWATVAVGNLDGSWAAVSGTVVAAAVAGQLAAARDAETYLAAVLAEQGARDAAEGAVQAAAFAGVAADGRSLVSLLAEPLISVKTALKGGAAPVKALASGGSRLEMLTTTTAQDAGRAAVTAGMIARPNLAGYARVLTPPSCSRCVVLAGRVYRWSTGFQRHPRDDCTMQPSTSLGEAEKHTIDPYAAFRAGQVRGLSKAEQTAISDGADLNQVVNAHRSGAYQGLTTSEGTTKRGLASYRLEGRRRLTVGGIQRIASDRAEAVSLLRANGFILS